MFTLASQWGLRADNPAHGIPRFQEDRRERWLSAEEIGRFWDALGKYKDQSAADALRLLLLTGSREGEVLTSDWDQFDLERGIWTKPSHHTKQKKIEYVPLSKAAVALLIEMKSKSSGGPLFPGAKRKGKGGKLTGGDKRVSLRRPWVQACKAAGLVEAIKVKGKKQIITRHRPLVRIHDLRHTYASHLVSAGMSLQIVGKLLGHTQPQTTARYAHVADAALRNATESFATILDKRS
jgi:integrase